MSSSIADEITCRRGFTLMEVMIGMLLLALVVGASGVAMVHFSQRTGEARLAVADLQQQQRFVQIITDDLVRLKDITAFTSTQFTFTVDDGAGGATSVSYTWTAATKTFTRRLGASLPVTLADNLTEFNLEYETVDQNDTEYIRGICLKMGWDGESEHTLLHRIELTNPLLLAEAPPETTMTGSIVSTTTTSTLKTLGTYIKIK